MRLFKRSELLLCRDVQDKGGEARCIWSLGDIALRQSGHKEAEGLYNQALALFRDSQDKYGEAWCLWDLGQIARMRSEYGEAARLYTQALPLFRVHWHNSRYVPNNTSF